MAVKGDYFRIEVETYDGFKGAERPMAFTWKGRRIECQKILDRWYGESYEYFKVAGDDSRTYVLRYDRARDYWEISAIPRS